MKTAHYLATMGETAIYDVDGEIFYVDGSDHAAELAALAGAPVEISR